MRDAEIIPAMLKLLDCSKITWKWTFTHNVDLIKDSVIPELIRVLYSEFRRVWRERIDIIFKFYIALYKFWLDNFFIM